MDQGPLVAEEIEAGARFLRELSKRIPVHAAFWLRADGEMVRFLYVVADENTEEDYDRAHREANRIFRESPDPWLESCRVNLIGTDDPLAKAAFRIQQAYPGRAPLRFADMSFGWVIADDLYLYPPPSLVTVT